MSRRTGLWSLVFISLSGLAIALTIPVSQLQAQPRATIEAQAESVRQTAQAVQQNLQAQTSGIQQTLQAEGESLQQTLQAGTNDLRGTLEAGLPAFEATAQYVATAISQQVGDIEATVTAISATIQAALAELPEDVQALLSNLAQQASLSYDPATKLLTVTSFITEAQANEVQDLVVEAAGYNPQAVSLDTRDDGTIIVTMMNVSDDLSGMVLLTYNISVVNGRVTATLTNVTINGANVPTERIPEDLQSAVQLGILGSAMQTAVSVPAEVPFVYTVDSATVSDTGILIVYEVTVA
jgi:hypothetical protein